MDALNQPSYKLSELANILNVYIQNVAYFEMPPLETQIVAEYEFSQKVEVIDRLLDENQCRDGIEAQVHDWWSDYEISQECEEMLYQYINEYYKKKRA